jgi:putative intracellular protease/amidase
MSQSPEFLSPLAWSAPSFSLAPYNLIFLPGGHEKGVRQLIDSRTMQSHLGSYFPETEKTKNGGKAVAAVCHGVMALAEAKVSAEVQEGDAEDEGNGKGKKGKSVLHDAVTTALPARFEQVAFWGTRIFLGDYYKTYGVGSDDVQAAVSKHLGDPKKQYKNSLGLKP